MAYDPDEMSKDEIVSALTDEFIGIVYEQPSGQRRKVTAARVRSGKPELQVTPLDERGNEQPINKNYISGPDFKQKVLSESGDWVIVSEGDA